MYLFVFNYNSGNIDVVTNVPEDIKDNIEDFVINELGYSLNDFDCMLTESDNVFNILKYNKEDNSVVDTGLFDYIETKF